MTTNTPAPTGYPARLTHLHRHHLPPPRQLPLNPPVGLCWVLVHFGLVRMTPLSHPLNHLSHPTPPSAPSLTSKVARPALRSASVNSTRLTDSAEELNTEKLMAP